MRDNLREKENFLEIIKRQVEYINEEYEDLNELPEENKEKFIFDTYYTICKYSLDNIIAKYSLGEKSTALKTSLTNLISNLKHCWQSDSGYVPMLWVLSIGIMLEVEVIDFNKLVQLIEKDNPNDYLVDFLIHSRDNTWDIKHTNFKFDTPYKSLEEVISLAKIDKQKSVERLKLYLDKEWYKGHSDTGWYDSHKSEHNIYSGYWCWEAGALVKILGLDDSSLKEQQYYPYDMVHWT